MKKTKYFISKQAQAHDLPSLVSEAEDKRDSFIRDNLQGIGEIEGEQIQVVASNNNSYIQVIISLTFYPKS